METAGFVTLRRKKNQDLVLVVNPDGIRYYVKRVIHGVGGPVVRLGNQVFDGIDTIFNHKRWLLLVIALGLGIGMGMTIFTQPSSSTAFPSPVVLSDTILPRRIEIEGTAIDKKIFNEAPSLFTTTEVGIVQSQANGFGESGLIRIELPGEYAALSEVKLGQRVNILADNNGLYTFQVTEIRQVAEAELSTIQVTRGPVVMIYSFDSVINRQALVLLARAQ
ncbi:MAG TPA: hypothetical protein VD999_04950 [Vitreimonas sp.]|nr:hypothetical protein [Vitreimonas sp.]